MHAAVATRDEGQGHEKTEREKPGEPHIPIIRSKAAGGPCLTNKAGPPGTPTPILDGNSLFSWVYGHGCAVKS
jgi:hypothetical protein